MVSAYSDKVSRVSSYSGYCCVTSRFAYGAFTLFGRSFQDRSATVSKSLVQSEPRNARISVWALPISLAATFGIDFSFFSSGYLDVSVHRVPSVYLWIQYTVTEVFSAGFPHSDIHGSIDICSSPWLFAAYHVFLRLLVPRHPPCALICLTIRIPPSVGTDLIRIFHMLIYQILAAQNPFGILTRCITSSFRVPSVTHF